jgi:hypothetical protein
LGLDLPVSASQVAEITGVYHLAQYAFLKRYYYYYLSEIGNLRWKALFVSGKGTGKFSYLLHLIVGVWIIQMTSTDLLIHLKYDAVKS